MGSTAPSPPLPDALLPAGRQPPPPLVAFGQEAATGRPGVVTGLAAARAGSRASPSPSLRPSVPTCEPKSRANRTSKAPAITRRRRPGSRCCLMEAGAGPQRGRAALPWQPRDRPPSRHRVAQGDSFPSAASPGLGLPATVPAPSRAAAAQRRDREGAAEPRAGAQRFGATPGSCKNREPGSNFRHFYAGIVDYDRHGMGPSTHRCDVIGARRRRGRTSGAGYSVGGSGLCAAPSLPGQLSRLPRFPRRPLGSASASDRRDRRVAAQRAMGRGGVPQAGAGRPGLGAAC